MSESTMAFGKVLRRLRSAAGLSQEELAELSGLSRSGVSNLERGLHPAPRLETVRMLADGLRLGKDERATLLAAARPMLWQDNGTASATDLPPRGSAPPPLTRLIGREAEVSGLRALLQDTDVRLVTLTGPGGVGKTRLAIEVAAELAGAYPGGVVFVDLSALIDHSQVFPSVAASLGVREVSNQQLHGTLCQELAGQRMLLVLDNCDRVLPVAPSLAALCSANPRLTLLATSRQPFRVRGETEVPLLPLPVLALDQQENMAEMAANPPVALFVERAAAVEPGFTLCAENACAIAAICRRLDGLPLAIELAASRIRVLTPAALEARLERRLPLLTGGGRDAPARQRSMRDTITWSYDLLTPDEQSLFRRVAVFVDGFTLEAAEATGKPGAQLPAVDGIGALVEQSFLHRIPDSGDEPRFRMLDTLREFGLEQLDGAGEAAAARLAHASYFVDFAERGYLYHLALHDSVDRRFQRIEADHANLVLALTTLANAHDAHGVARLAGALGLFWQLRGYLGEGRIWLEWALAHGEEMPPLLRCRVLASLSSVQWAQGQNDEAAAAARSSLRLAEQGGDTNMLAYATHVLGLVADSQQRWPKAEALFARALKLWRELGVRAEEAIALRWLSGAAYGLGDHALSAMRAEAALSLSRELGHAFGAAAALGQLAKLARDAGDTQRETAAYQEALRLLAGNGNRWSIRNPIAGLAGVAADQGQPDVAARLVGAVEGLTHAIGCFVGNDARDNCVRAVALASAALGERQVAELRAAGRALRLEDAVALAAAIPSAERSSPTGGELPRGRRQKLRHGSHRAKSRSRGAMPKALRRPAFQ